MTTIEPRLRTPEAHVPEAGDLAPAFDLPASFNRRVGSCGLRGTRFVLYLYPKADTAGCTRQACDFQQALPAFGRSGLAVVGLSRDPIKAIEAFATRFGLAFPLASDADGAVVAAYGSWVGKSMYGRQYMGIDRSTFLVGADGRIVRAWRKVKVAGHVAEVLRTATAASGNNTP